MNNSLLNVLLKAADSESARNLLKELAGVDVAAMQRAQALKQEQTISVQSMYPKPLPTPTSYSPTPSVTSMKTPSMSDRIITDQTGSSTVVQPASSGEVSYNPIYEEEIRTEPSILSLERDAVLGGIIWSEVLGKPKGRRRH